MAGSFSNYTENKVLDHIVGKTSFTMPSVWVALSTADPTDDGSGIAEPVGGSYARKSTAGADWNAAAAGATSNANVITFVTATASWGTISHFALFDAVTAGNMLAHGDLTTAKAVGNGDTAKFNAGDLDLTLD
jgi:hypothetical protein